MGLMVRGAAGDMESLAAMMTITENDSMMSMSISSRSNTG